MYFSEINLSSTISVNHIDGKKVEKPYNYINPLFYYTLIIKDYEQTHTSIYEYLEKVEEQVRDVVIGKFSKINPIALLLPPAYLKGDIQILLYVPFLFLIFLRKFFK